MPSLSLYPLPDLNSYDISPVTGFLPEQQPLERLPSYFDLWENVVSNIVELLEQREFRLSVNKMPLLSCDRLKDDRAYRRAYSVLGYIAHAYIWADEAYVNRLPTQLAKPWVEVSDYLGLLPIASYSGLILWNWKFVNSKHPQTISSFEPENIEILNTFTGSSNECWFYLLSIYFEYIGAPCITTGLKAIEYARKDNPRKVIQNINTLTKQIEVLKKLLTRMHEHCDPSFFYTKLRPFLAGWKNMKNAGLEGVYYGDSSKKLRVYSGGSNAQSSLIQTLDLILNIKHKPCCGGHKSKENDSFSNEMKKYMPRKHRDFLNHLSKVNLLRDYALNNAETCPELLRAYNSAVTMMKQFRDGHIQLVTRYIIIQARNAQKCTLPNSKTPKIGLANAKFQKSSELRGTGGTELIPFLKRCRDETENSLAGSIN